MRASIPQEFQNRPMHQVLKKWLFGVDLQLASSFQCRSSPSMRSMNTNFVWPEFYDLESNDMWFELDDTTFDTAHVTLDIMYEKMWTCRVFLSHTRVRLNHKLQQSWNPMPSFKFSLIYAPITEKCTFLTFEQYYIPHIIASIYFWN